MKKLNIVLSIALGLVGGVLSHYLWSQPVHAQAQGSAPQEIRSQRFVLVDENGVTQGIFTFDKKAPGPSIRLFDGKGKEIWRASENSGVRLLGNQK